MVTSILWLISFNYRFQLQSVPVCFVYIECMDGRAARERRHVFPSPSTPHVEYITDHGNGCSDSWCERGGNGLEKFRPYSIVRGFENNSIVFEAYLAGR